MTQGNMPEVGPLGRNLIANVDRLRQERGLSWRRLSAALEATGRPIPPLGLTRMARGERRMDVDDLAALARVLDVPPAVLLAPPGEVPVPEHAALLEVATLAGRIGQLLAADGDPALAARQAGRALRRVQIELEELLEEALGPEGKAG